MKPLFVHIPKNAGTSIRTALRNQYTIPFNLFAHVTHSQMHARASYIGYDYDYTFTVVRHPIDRLYSVYNHAQKTVFEKIHNYSDLEYHFITKTQLLEFHKNFASINLFVEHFFGMVNTSKHIWSYHYFLPQSTWMDSTEPCEVFQFENLQPLEEKLQISLPRENVSNASRPPLSRRSVDLLYNYYEQDFKNFGYRLTNPQKTV